MQLVAERLEQRAMLATTATLSGNTAPFTTIPLTFRQLDGSVGFSGQTLVGQLSWSGMTGDAAALGVPSSFTSFCINGLRTIRPGTVTFPQFATDLADFPYGNDSIDTPRANLLESFWRQYGPATAAGFTDKIDSAAFQLAVWEIINDGGLIGSRLSFNLAAGQFSVAAAGLTLPAAARAQQWLAAYDTAGIERNRVDLYALWHQTLQPQVVPVFNPITITATNAIASEDPSLGPDRGEYVISRGEGNVTGDLKVSFRVPATVPGPLSIASLDTDYTLSVGGLPISLSPTGEGSVTIPDGKSSVSIRLAVAADSILEWDETARVEILPAPTG